LNFHPKSPMHSPITDWYCEVGFSSVIGTSVELTRSAFIVTNR
jgi:hypothetical protein